MVTDRKQLSLINESKNARSADTSERNEPATEVMKAVAAHAPNQKMMEKVFTPQEIDDIMLRRECGEELTKADGVALRKHFAKMKRWALEKEKTNNQQLIFVPVITDDKGFYKAFELLPN